MDTYRLSRNFYTTEYNEEPMNPIILKLKSIVALLLGIIPFALTNLFLMIFRYMASKRVKPIGFLSAAFMMTSAKVFSISQWLVWRKYVPRPSGDSINSRLAQYAWGNQPWLDLKTIYFAFYNPDKLEPNERNLQEWSMIKI